LLVAVPPLTSPLAASFIDNYRSFILMHALFALAERRLETLYTAYGTMLIDLVTFVEEEWDKLLTSIETGTLPDLEGIEHVRSYLEVSVIEQELYPALTILEATLLCEPGTGSRASICRIYERIPGMANEDLA
jgi:hypothetical protein